MHPQVATSPVLTIATGLQRSQLRCGPDADTYEIPAGFLIARLTMFSPSPPHPLLGLSGRVRLHLPAHCDHETTRSRSAVHAADISIPRQMALLPLYGHARALQCHILALQLPRTLLGHAAAPRQDTRILRAPQILPMVRIRWACELDVQHDLPRSRLQSHREARLLCGRCKCAIWTILRADTRIQAGEE